MGLTFHGSQMKQILGLSLKTSVFLMLGAHAHEGYSTHFVCMCVLPVCCLHFTLIHQNMTYQLVIRQFSFVLNFVDFEKPSLQRNGAFHGYLVVYSR